MGGGVRYLSCVRAALWPGAAVCCPAERMEMMTEEVEERGYVRGCLLTNAFCAESCASGAALEPLHRPHGTARWTCAACTAVEEEEQKNHWLVVCWKMEVWRCRPRRGLCWAWEGGASLCCERRNVEQVLSGWGWGERCYGLLC